MAGEESEGITSCAADRGRAEWVNVKRGGSAGDLVEVFGNLSPDDQIVKRASDEIREGSALKVK